MQLRAVDGSANYVLKLAKNRTLLGYHWTGPDLLADLFLVHSGGLDLYKVQEQPLRLQPVKNYSLPTAHYWFEPRNGIVLLANSHKPGVLQAYFYRHAKVPKFEGPKVQLPQAIPASSWASDFPHIPVPARPTDYRGLLAEIYEIVHFIYICHSTGQIRIYLIQQQGVTELPDILQRSPGIYDLYVMDNLLMLQSEARQEEYVYDLKGGNQPFVTVRYGQESREITGYVYRRDPLLSHLIRVDQDILIDRQAGCCYRLDFKPSDLIHGQNNLLSVLPFLLRRKGCRYEAFAYLRDQILAQVPLKTLSKFFMASSKAYREVALRVAPHRNSLNQEQRQSLTLEADLKAESGVTVMLQGDMYTLVLKEICEAGLPATYVTAVLLEYQRSLLVQEIHVSQGVQLLLARHLIQSGNFVLLQTLLHHRSFSDSSDLVWLVLSASSAYPGCLQQALDMLQRLKASGQTAQLLVERQLFFEVCSLASTWTSELIQTTDAALASLPPSESVSLARDFLHSLSK